MWRLIASKFAKIILVNSAIIIQFNLNSIQPASLFGCKLIVSIDYYGLKI